MKHFRTTPTVLRRTLVILGVALLAACGDKHEDTASSTSGMVTRVATHAATDGDNAQLARGRYLVKAADCAACHTSASGAAFAGGVQLSSPFGTFYGTNITPDKEHGIGKWSADDFYKAIHDGISPNGPLYPAMPYASYRQISRADSDAIYAYLMSVKPMAVVNREPDLQFPYNMRFGVRFWNMLFLKDTTPDASSGQSADWQRGRYLVGALGHCAECHTSRGIFGQLDTSKTLAGASLGRVFAPDITPAGLTSRGWTAADLQTFLATGIAKQGSAFGEMYPVVHLSSQYMSPEDLHAMTVYLLGDHPAAVPQVPPTVPSADIGQLAAGRNVYLAVCAGCHGLDGEGKPHVAVAMRGNSTVRQEDPHNLIVAMLDGIEAQDFHGLESMQKMPGFARTLSDEEVSQLADYLRAKWGGQAADVTANAVKALRK